ncbi:protein norD [Rhizobium sp. Root274]|uniref:nitric oxide reductase activation protein NorD n=1 Tax=unclassified Rhizobium TaxID=2613769 RepID=UPI0007153342|nr:MULTISPECIES: VWA domain-containing protein [unclassified Rhizobium]KQW31650.1 protein norD [Rhizobium sp. Root1240]KRD33191.1 protein norD [Rhizobium sp. Root274]
MLDFLELEETVGRAWHRLAGGTQTWPRYPQAAVTLEEMLPILSVCFRGFGGERTVQLVPARGKTSQHRLKLRQRMGLGEEKLVHPARDEASVMLPPVLDLMPEPALNRDLYVWLAAAMAVMPLEPMTEIDPLQADLEILQSAKRLEAEVLAAFPGLRDRYRRLCLSLLSERRRGSLPRVEGQVEDLIIDRLRAGAGLAPLSTDREFPRRAPAGYLPMLPVPLWPQAVLREEWAGRESQDQPIGSGERDAQAAGRHLATREKDSAGKGERSPFILNRFEKILAMAEMVNVDRPSDDSDDHDSSAADELDEMVLGERKGRPSAKFRFDLDLPPEALRHSILEADLTYPEWDYRRGVYLKDHCRVVTGVASGESPTGQPSEEMKALVRRVRRQFEAMRPRHEMLRAQVDGSDLDLDAVVRSRTELAASGECSDRIHLSSRPQGHDLAVTLLVDVSLSTDAWFNDRRVLDVEKEALLVLAEGLAACGDMHSILSFTSRRRDWVRVETVKDFDEPMSALVRHRIAALKPGYYTRMGAAIRHSTTKLAERPNRKHLLLVLTDGKPNDVDHYEGRFALEDTRRAVTEARRSGIHVFGVTVDQDAKTYVPAVFGHHGYAVVPDIRRLPAALPQIYRALVR